MEVEKKPSQEVLQHALTSLSRDGKTPNLLEILELSFEVPPSSGLKSAVCTGSFSGANPQESANESAAALTALDDMLREIESEGYEYDRPLLQVRFDAAQNAIKNLLSPPHQCPQDILHVQLGLSS